jgi:hypothetical protein
MLKSHIIIFETKEYGLIAYSTTKKDAFAKIKMNKDYKIYYVFECNLLKDYPYTMKLKYPLNEYYDRKSIIKYKEEEFREDEEYIIIVEDGNENSIFYNIKHKNEL